MSEQVTSPRVAMISGASRGIGAAISRRLKEEGWQLSLGVRRPEAIDPTLTGEQVLVHPYDAATDAFDQDWVEATIKRFGRLDALINNAGIMIPKTVIEAEDADIDEIFDINVKAPLRLARAAWPHLKETGAGRVISVVSLSGHRVKSARSGLYSMSKYAALALSHALRKEGWEDGVRATALCPGLVATDMGESVGNIPPEQMTQPEDLARLVSMALEMPNTASLAEINVNALLDDYY
ncbi:SDR family NAD(P)-dependent oxidoreductase [Kushneria marisflavi]|uniref:Short-chain dehydrogenase n=1 Tax=Kushneria marisflavi TaxID=157779 RepID=A0A240UNG0_9GAMM|nr:SDR family NAD(P)-dependent oxidoreductase [Kushneria marisflavi]ART62666.1 short-chain dehydrogenase [Kushneria marisflavi]RKD83942.1 NADP-dependent 3-hydroxy acid dehydrogenase YdfG [Kushneria marisflavi]